MKPNWRISAGNSPACRTTSLARIYEIYRIACGLREDGIPRLATMPAFPGGLGRVRPPVGAVPIAGCDILTPMNYRRGLQRIYAVLTVTWIVGALWVVFSGRSLPPWLGSWAAVRSLTDLVTVNPLVGWSLAVWLWAIGLSMFPPVLFYVILFYVVPWIYRGFKPNG
jgi:hypothetical protein